VGIVQWQDATFPRLRREFDSRYPHFCRTYSLYAIMHFMKNVSIYSTPNCTYCKKAKEFFNEKKVTFNEFDVAADEQKRNEMIDMTGQMGVPVIRVDDEVIVGYDRATLAQMLGIEA
jgi:glutaredoxin 3